MRRLVIVLIFWIFPCSAFLPLVAQSPTATVNGQVRDTSGAVVIDADVQLVNDRTNAHFAVKTNRDGIYSVTNLPPGSYHIQVSKAGFKTILKPDIELNVLDARAINFDLPVGAVSQTVTVEGGASTVDTETAAVSTVVDRQFAENLPMNGRSFQTLIQLTPGVVLTTSSSYSDGQFSINGQRPDSNYWMIDGVSANIGVSSALSASDTLSGSLGGFSAQGGTNSLVSVDAMQEFRIQTSTFAPEFGRTPGGQISIATRSGTNQFHGSAFDYFRNDVLDAGDWFNGFINVPALRKPEERQNDFGATLGGPIIRNRTFFFFSYEGLRLRLPQTGLSTVPDASFTPGGTTNSRQNAIPVMQPFLNAFPLPNPNSPEILCDPIIDPYCPASGLTGSAAFNASYSNRSTLNATSLRIDHRLTDKLTLFGRYNYAPSELLQRRGSNSGAALNNVITTRIPTQTATLGATWLVSPTLSNDIRANYSWVHSEQGIALDNFGGATPFVSSLVGLPSPYTSQNSTAVVSVASISSSLAAGNGTSLQRQRQINLVDSVAVQVGTHALKMGVDYRRLTPSSAYVAYNQTAGFSNMNAFESGSMDFGGYVIGSGRVPLILQNLGLFAQDTWQIHRRLTLTYGLRWDVDFSPRTSSGPSLPTVVNFNDPTTLALAPPGSAVFSTQFGNVAPRVGLAYQLRQEPGWESVLRGGWGLFYDLATTQLQVQGGSYPFGSSNFLLSGQFPMNPGCSFDPVTCPNSSQPPPISAANPTIYALDPHLKAPYTQEWNFALEQSLGPSQSFSATYLGAAGRRLLVAASYSSPNPNVGYAILTGNYGTSDYDALQLQFRRRLTRGLQVLGSYSWSHSFDTGSTGAGGLSGSDLNPGTLGAHVNRGPSDFDIRNSTSVALTYDVPPAKATGVVGAISRGWSTENVFQARSATPVDVNFPYQYFIGPSQVALRPDVEPGQPFYLNPAQCLSVLSVPCPGGKGFNPQAFSPQPPDDPKTGLPTEGDLGRNALRGFGAWQWDFAVHRDFSLGEHVKMQFRSEMFNVLNHPNFGPPNGSVGYSSFGYSNQSLGQSLGAGNSGTGGFNPLYEFGGPRSVQLALKLMF